MSYFKNFPKIGYRFNTTDKTAISAVNIMATAIIKDLVAERSDKAYVDYVIPDGERPEHIAERVYGKPDYYWVVLLSNGIVNPYFEWPLSSHALENYITKKYPGSALFFSCIGETKFLIKGSTSYLDSTESHFVEGNTVYQSSSRTATIHKWSPTLRKLVITDASADFDTASEVWSDNSDGTVFVATPIKHVLFNSEALHHFQDDFGNPLDTYGKLNYYAFPDDHLIYSRQNIFYDNTDGIPNAPSLTSGNDFALNKYIAGMSQVNAITNRQYENIENDKKRHIKILRIEYADQVIANLANIFK